MTYSYTQISQYLTCPRRYRHRYLDGWKEKDTRAAICSVALSNWLWALTSGVKIRGMFYSANGLLARIRTYTFPIVTAGIACSSKASSYSSAFVRRTGSGFLSRVATCRSSSHDRSGKVILSPTLMASENSTAVSVCWNGKRRQTATPTNLRDYSHSIRNWSATHG